MATLPKGLDYLVGLLAAGVIFLLFAALRLGGDVTPVASVLLASSLAALGAAAFGFLSPAHAWRWGLVISSVFALYLLVAFAAFAVNGEAEWWPLVEAAVIGAAACAGAMLGGAMSPRRARP